MGNSTSKKYKKYDDKLKRQEEDFWRVKTELENYKVAYGFLENVAKERANLKSRMLGESRHFPGSVNFPNRLFVSLFGDVAAGKSSLINSLKFAVDGELENKMMVQTGPINADGGHTSKSLEVPLTEHLSVIDHPGIKAESASSVAILTGIVDKIEGRYGISNITWVSLAPADDDQMSCCSVLVFSAHNPETARRYRSIIRKIHDWQGCYPPCIITHVDKEEPEAVRLALQSAGVSKIFEIANITPQHNKLDIKHELTLLELLLTCFEFAEKTFLFRQRHDALFENIGSIRNNNYI